jgi:hypothetical protein
MEPFKQKSLLGTSLEISVRGDDIQVTMSRPFSRYSYDLKASWLVPRPVVSRQFPEAPFISALICAGLALVVLGSQFFLGFAIMASMWSVFFALSAVVFWAFFLNRYENQMYFVNKFDNAPSIALKPSNPNQEEFEGFVAEFSKYLSEYDIGDDSDLVFDHTMAGEIKKLHNLMEEGIISDTEFNKAKAKFLDMDNWETEF